MKTKTIGVVAPRSASTPLSTSQRPTALHLLGYARPFTLSWQADAMLFATTALVAYALFTSATEVAARGD